MLRITRDKAELRGAPFVTFRVYRSNMDSVCAYHDIVYHLTGNRIRVRHTPFGIPVAQAFEETCRFAKLKRISAIWVDDPDRLFQWEQHW